MRERLLMSDDATPWPQVAKEICASLADGLDVLGTVETADIFTRVGATCLEVVIDATDTEGAEQAGAYETLCDLLDTRYTKGRADVVYGCMLFDGEPDPDALVVGITHMTRQNGRFVPVLPLGRDQAMLLASSPVDLADIAEQTVGLMAAIAGHPTPEHARTLLTEIDELISRRCATRDLLEGS
jgi:hypothetical protein